MFKRLLLLLLVIISLMISSCTSREDKEQQPAVFKQDQETQDIKPENPVKIKLKRSAKNEYSWEVNGDNADEVIKADKRLKEGLKE